VSRNRLAMTHHRAGDLNRAIPLLKSALAVYERILSPRHGEAVPLQQVRPCLSPVGLPPQHQLPPRKPVPVERSGPWNPSNGSARENTNIPPGVSRRATSGNSSSGSVNHTAPTPSSSHRSRPRPQPETRMPRLTTVSPGAPSHRLRASVAATVRAGHRTGHRPRKSRVIDSHLRSTPEKRRGPGRSQEYARASPASTAQWQFCPGAPGPHWPKSRSQSGQSTAKPLPAMMWAVA
jgi:hypothetical protein